MNRQNQVMGNNGIKFFDDDLDISNQDLIDLGLIEKNVGQNMGTFTTPSIGFSVPFEVYINPHDGCNAHLAWGRNILGVFSLADLKFKLDFFGLLAGSSNEFAGIPPVDDITHSILREMGGDYFLLDSFYFEGGICGYVVASRAEATRCCVTFESNMVSVNSMAQLRLFLKTFGLSKE